MKLGPDKKDIAVSLSKGILGAIPTVGPLVAEVVGTLIPNQRLDRLERFLEQVSEALGDTDQETVHDEFRKAEFIDLLEDGFCQAARALSDDRLKYIASLVASGLTKEDAEYVRYKKMLAILGALNDAEILFLIMYGRHEVGDRTFMDKHPDVLHPKNAASGSSLDEKEAAWLQESYKKHLVDMGLLRPNFRKPKRGEFPEFDPKTGMMKASGYELTVLGRLMLKHIGERTIWDNRTSQST